MQSIANKDYEIQKIEEAVKNSISYASTLKYLDIEYNSNRYLKLKKIIEENNIDVTHFDATAFSRPDEIKIWKDIISTSFSYRDSLIKKGIKISETNYSKIKKIIKDNNIDISHFLGPASNLKRTFPERQKVTEQFLIKNGNKITSSKLKYRLLKDNIFERKCYNCNLTEWLNIPIPLELHHKDGDKQNNEIENLDLLCPNCHTLTNNYRGKNKGNYLSDEEKEENETFDNQIDNLVNNIKTLL
jgi:hypothetical protein